MTPIDSTKLRYFCAVAETGSLREAATLLRLSPAALSKAIKGLEAELGLKLITPSGRGIVLTDVGKAVSRKGKQLVSDLDALGPSAREESERERPLRLGTFEVFSTYFLGHLLRSGALDPVATVVHDLLPGHLEQALIDRKIDLGVTYIPVPTADIDHLKATTLKMGVFIAEKGPLLKTPFASVPFAIPVEPLYGSPNKVHGLDGWPDSQVPRLVRYRVTLMESALELCRQGLAAAYLPRFVVELHNRQVREGYRLREIPSPRLPHGGSQPVYLVKRKTDDESEPARKLARALRGVATSD